MIRGNGSSGKLITAAAADAAVDVTARAGYARCWHPRLGFPTPHEAIISTARTHTSRQTHGPIKDDNQKYTG